MKAEELKGHLDGLILSVVSRGPLHGYAVIEALKARSGGSLALPEGTVYPALHRLEDDGLLKSEWSNASGRRRRVYSITKRGEKELGASRERWRLFFKHDRGGARMNYLDALESELKAAGIPAQPACADPRPSSQIICTRMRTPNWVRRLSWRASSPTSWERARHATRPSESSPCLPSPGSPSR